MQTSLFLETRRAPRNPFGAAVSFICHGAALAWVAVLPAAAPREQPKSAYDELIKPHENKLVWYRFSEKLPETRPEAKPAGAPKARNKAPQNIVARGASGADQMIWQPVPRIDLPKEVPSPNIVAMRIPQAPPPPDRPKPKLFNPPREALREAIPDLLSPAPELETNGKTQVAGLERGLADALKNRPRFVPPPERARPTAPDPQLPQAPEVQVATDSKVPSLEQGLQDALRNKPQAKKFVPPVSRRPEARPADLGQAPEVQVATTSKVPSLEQGLQEALRNKPQAKKFVPPVSRRPEARPAEFAQSPPVQAAGASPVPTLGQGVNEALKNRPRFVPPPERARTPAAPTMIPQAPGVQMAANSAVPIVANDVRDALNNRPRPKAFRPPPYRRVEALPPVLEEAPTALTSAARADVNAAIVGLRPAPRLDAPLPEGSRQAEFSAGPKLSAEGGEPESRSAMLSVPGIAIGGSAAKPEEPAAPVLVARASPTSMQNLMAAARAAPVPSTIQQGETTALRVATDPDGQFAGRAVYSLSVQMPNITSYYGSWMVWFAERDPSARAGLQPPAPLRKVDPRYVPSAVAEKIEGVVRLTAVIRQDGTLDNITVVRSLDSRLDFAAREALSKWLFEPATRDGAPIDVDAVVEVPFRLAPPDLRYR